MAADTARGRTYATIMLSAATVGEIAERFRETLDGRWFTLVQCNSYDEHNERFASVEVYPSQYLTRPSYESSWGDDVCGLSWCTPRYSMGVHTTAKTQAEAHAGRPHQFVQFTFEPDRVVIDHYAPAGYRLRWTLAVEHHDTEMAGAPAAGA